MRYIVINVGCLCCSTTDVVAVVSNEQEAKHLCDHVNYGMQSTQDNCVYFPIPDQDTIDPKFKETIDLGKLRKLHKNY